MRMWHNQIPIRLRARLANGERCGSSLEFPRFCENETDLHAGSQQQIRV